MTIYVVFYKTDIVFAFHTRPEAEEYIRTTSQRNPGVYTRDTLYLRAVDFLEIPATV